MESIDLAPGHTYIGGADVPALVSNGAIVDEAPRFGFVDVRVWSADDFPLNNLPQDPDVNTIAIGRYVGPPGQLRKLPKQLRWVRDLGVLDAEGKVVAPASSGAPAAASPARLPPSAPPSAGQRGSGVAPIALLVGWSSAMVALGGLAGWGLGRWLR